MEIRSLHSDADHTRALALIDQLWDREDEASQNVVEVLAILVEAWEREHHQIRHPDPIEAIRFRMQQIGYTNADLGRVLNSRSRATEILAGTRGLTLAMVRRLSQQMDIPAAVLIQERPAAKRRAPRRAAASTSKKTARKSK